MHCLKTWKHYLLGGHFTVFTDNVTISYFITQPKLNPKQARWQDGCRRFVKMTVRICCSDATGSTAVMEEIKVAYQDDEPSTAVASSNRKKSTCRGQGRNDSLQAEKGLCSMHGWAT